MTCLEIQDRLAAFADGSLSAAERPAVEAHLAVCASCQQQLAIQASTRQLLLAARPSIAAAAPPWLQTRIAARLASEAAPVASPGWRTRVTAFAAAAMVVLAIGAVVLPIVTGRSTVVLAAQLALDHLKCFSLDGDDGSPTLTVAEAEAELAQEYGWTLRVPADAGSEEARLVAVRRCLYGDGRAAHLLYRDGGEPVSLFILPGLERPERALTLLGHDEVVWTQGGRTYVLVGAAGRRNRLMRMASNLRNEAQ